jgi:NSS family neurotransmitter:Na+ symporter
VAALTSSIYLLEVIVAYFTEELKMTRLVAVIITFLVIGFFGTLSSLSQGSLKEFTIFGKTVFDFFDYISSNFLLPVGGLFVVMFVGWKMKRAEVFDELSSGGAVHLSKILINGIMVGVKFLAPIAISIVLLNSLGLIKLF